MYCTPSCHSTAMVLASSTRSAMVSILRRVAASTSFLTRVCISVSLASACTSAPSIFTKSSSMSASRPCGVAAASRRPRGRSGSPACAGTLPAGAADSTWLAATDSGTWKHRRCGSAWLERSARRASSRNVVSLTVSFESRTNRQPGFLCAANDSDAPTTQRSMFFRRSLRSAAAMNSAGQHLLALRVDHAHQHVEHARIVCPAGSRPAAARGGSGSP